MSREMKMKGKVPNQLLNLALSALEEVMGKSGVNSVLNYAKLQKFIDNYPPYNLEPEQTSEDFAHLLTAIIDILGGGRLKGKCGGK